MLVKIEGKTKIFGKTIFGNGDYQSIPISNNIFWGFSNSSGTTLNGVNVIYHPSLNDVQLDWGDGSQSQNINSGVNYNHTFN